MMKKKNDILFVQSRTHKAGAQTSLNRLAQALMKSKFTPSAVFGQHGWLSEAFASNGLPQIVDKWPSPRSFIARMGGLNCFAKKTIVQLKRANIHPKVIIANDHQECPLALSIAKRLKIPVVAILRSSGMTKAHFSKYRCGETTHLFAVGMELQSKVTRWNSEPCHLYTEGFTEDELINKHPKLSKTFPLKVLIVATPKQSKGIPDLLEALSIIDKKRPDFGSLHCSFTCTPPEDSASKKYILKNSKHKFNFIGRIEDLTGFARGFDFAIHPSRRETFGMAPLELMLSGVPTLSTDTGQSGQIGLPHSWLAPTSNPKALAKRILTWHDDWRGQSSQIHIIQSNLQSQFDIRKTSQPFIEILKELTLQS